jgi:FlaA1/EpsC-like NDP-sugar epimerase
MLLQMLDWPRPVKRAVVVLTDVTLALLATWMAYSIRMEALHWPQGAEWWTYAISPALAVPIFAAFGLYRAIFRYSGLASLYKTGQAIAVVAGALIAVHLWRLWPTFPLTLGVLLPIIFFALVATSRVAAQLWLTRYNHRGPIAQGRMLIYGAGAAGVQTSSAMAITRQFKLLGFVDDNPAKVGQTINGVPVYAPASLPTVVQSLLISDILLAMPSASRERRNTIIQGLRSLPVHTRTLPGLSDLASGRVTVQDFCELDVEDLLGREPVVPQADLINSSLRQLTILVTGAGGSIGSELCRQIVHEHPRRLLLLDHSEFALYTIHRELQGWCHTQDSSIELVPLLASVTNRTRLDWICTTYRPHTVYHAAAYKHVPMVECNPSEGMANNVFGTLNMAQAAQAAGVTRFVLVSTDKAVRPTNLMGASKRMAELVLQALAAQISPHSHRARHLLQHGALWQRAGLQRQRGAHVSRADFAWRPHHRNPPRGHPLFHDHPRGRAAGAAGRRHGHRGRCVCAGHGRAGQDHRPGAPPGGAVGPAGARCRPPRRRHRHCRGGPAPRREAV